MEKRVLPGLGMNTEEDRVNWYSSDLSTIIKEKLKERKEEEELMERREKELRELMEKSVLMGGGEGPLLDSDGLKKLSKDLNSLDKKLEGWIAEMDITLYHF